MRVIKNVGEEDWFRDFFMGECNSPLIPRLRDFKIESVLDIGCGDASALIMMHYMLGTEKLEGVERKRMDDLARERQDIYSLTTIWESITTDETCVVQRIEDPQLRGRRLAQLLQHVRFDKGLMDFTPREEQYDAIIACHVIHYLNKEEFARMSEWFVDRTHRCSLVYYSMKYDWKDGNNEPPLSGEVRLALCRELGANLSALGVKEYAGPKDVKGYQSYIFTNIEGCRLGSV